MATGGAGLHPVNASKITMTAAIAARFVMARTLDQSRHHGLNRNGPAGSMR
jgi:hypothetical protein